MRNLIIILIGILFPLISLAQRPEEMFDASISIRQTPNSQIKLINYFKPYNVADTAYAIIFPNANCPRCENIIMPMFNTLKKLSPSSQTVLISSYQDSIAAKKYNKTLNLTSDINIYDAEKRFSDFLNFSIGELHIPYFLKIDTKNGILITGFPAEDNSTELMKCVLETYDPMDFFEYPISEQQPINFTNPIETLKMENIFDLIVPNQLCLSEIIYKPDTQNNYLVFNDKLMNSIQLFELLSNNGNMVLKWKKEFKTDSIENRRFVTAPDSLTKHLYQNNELKYIALSPRFISDNSIAISYSLPNIWQTGQYGIAYKNEPSILVIDLENDSIRNLYNIPDSFDTPYYNAHFQIYGFNGEIAIKCQRRTWPLSIDVEDYEGKPEMNPFTNSFYTFKQPILNVFKFGEDKQMENDVQIGNLPQISAKSLTGYYFISPTLETFEEEVAISDGVSGNLTIFDSSCLDCPKREYSVFDIPLDMLPEPNPASFHTYECTTPYKSILCRNVYDVKFNKDYIFAIVRYGEHDENMESDKFSLVTIDRLNGSRKEVSFPSLSSEERLMAVGLWNLNNQIKPYMIISNSGKWSLLM